MKRLREETEGGETSTLTRPQSKKSRQVRDSSVTLGLPWLWVETPYHLLSLPISSGR